MFKVYWVEHPLGNFFSVCNAAADPVKFYGTASKIKELKTPADAIKHLDQSRINKIEPKVFLDI